MWMAVHPDAAQPDDQIVFKVDYQWKDGAERDQDGNLVDDSGHSVIRLPPCVDKV